VKTGFREEMRTRRMGKLLDALNRPQPRPEPGRPAQPSLEQLPVALAVECVPEPAPPEEAPTVPFIEVGGPRSAIDGSPEVLAVSPPSRGVPVARTAALADGTPREAPGMVSIWCSWTLRPGVHLEK
jgi:hypothetical protein